MKNALPRIRLLHCLVAVRILVGGGEYERLLAVLSGIHGHLFKTFFVRAFVVPNTGFRGHFRSLRVTALGQFGVLAILKNRVKVSFHVVVTDGVSLGISKVLSNRAFWLPIATPIPPMAVIGFK